MAQLEIALTYDDVLLVPNYGDSFNPHKGNLKTNITKKISVNQPIISSGMPTVTEHEMAIEIAKFGGVGIIHPYLNLDKYINEIELVKKQDCLVGAAVGDQDWSKVEAAIKANADFLAIDAAHGDTKKSLQFIKNIKKKFTNIEIMAGCFATPKGVYRAIKAGADSVRVGIGPGSHCTTRIVSGVGVPQITAIVKCSVFAKKYKVPLIAEGGIKNSGDIVKALAAGASAVMIGGMFVGTHQSPGNTFIKSGQKYKRSWGCCSLNAQINSSPKNIKVEIKKMIRRIFSLEDEQSYSDHISEGVDNVIIPYKGDVNIILQQLSNGIRTGLSYTGNKNIQSLQENKIFIRITNAGLKESFPHDVIIE